MRGDDIHGSDITGTIPMFCICVARKLGQFFLLRYVSRVANFLLKLPNGVRYVETCTVSGVGGVVDADSDGE